MTIAEILDTTATVFTLITTFLVLLTLREMKQQRRASYRPELLLRSFYSFSIYREKSAKGKQSFDLMTDRVVENQVQPARTPFPFEFRIAMDNIGLATAKNVEIEFQTDIPHLTEVVKELDSDGRFRASTASGLLSVSCDGVLSPHYFRLSAMEKLQVDYVPPRTDTSAAELIALPNYYVALIVAAVGLSVDKPETGLIFDILNKMPSLEISVKYEDIGDEKISATYRLSPSLVFVSTETQNEDSSGSVSIESKPQMVCAGYFSVEHRK